MSRPKASYPKNCKAAKTDKYYKWLLNNVDSWSKSDKDTVIRNANKWGLGVNQGMSNGELINEINNCLCRYATSDSERSACACQKSMNMMTATLNKNQELLDRNRSKLTGFSNSISDYNTKQADWTVRRGAKRVELDNYERRTGCNSKCRGGEQKVRTSGSSCTPAWDKRIWCKYTPSEIESQLKVWEAGNPKPVKPTDNNLETPSNIQADITCCSQTFKNINVKGGNLDMNNISQQCGGKVINAKNGSGGSGLGWWLFGGGSGGMSSSSSCSTCVIILLLLLL